MRWKERRRRAVNAVSLGTCVLLTAIAVVPLVAVIWHVASRGASALNWAFLTKLPVPVGEPGGGLGNAVVGSLLLILLASVIGVPIGVLGGTWLARSLGGRAAFWVRFTADVLQGVPSIVIGVVVYELLVAPMHGFSALSGGVALALIMIPTVVRTTEEMLRLVPQTLHDAALALGAPGWRATTFVLWRGARAGIVTGVMLAAARVAGETAPLLFTAFNNDYWSFSLRQPIGSLPVTIFDYAISPYNEWHEKAWAAALVLLILILGMSIVTRVATRGKYEIIQ
jgi:phosphate transport system permease protein